MRTAPKRRHTDEQLALLRGVAEAWEWAVADVLASGRSMRMAGGVLRIESRAARRTKLNGEWVELPPTRQVVWRRDAATSPETARHATNTARPGNGTPNAADGQGEAL